ncbi:MAG TPA: c-type cytochrome [Thermoleophilaceae bacterium]|nr:c-type cytochrome [Thermoleophilaceae bacterium]
MSLRRLILAAVLSALVLAGAAYAQPRNGVVRPPDQAQLPLRELGEQLYAGNCSACHGIDGRGQRTPRRTTEGIKGQGPSLRGVGARSVDFYLRTGYMPISNPDEQPTRRRPLFNDREIRAMVDYVSSLPPPGPPIPEPHPERGNLAEGYELFREHCAGCHQIAAQGGVVTGARVPPLEDATPVQIAQSVRIGPYLMPKFSERDISDEELDSIIAYSQLAAKEPVDEGGWGIGNLGPVPEGMVTWFFAVVVFVLICMVFGRRLRE